MIDLLLRFDAPVDIGRDQASELAQHELTDPVYANAEPPLWQRAGSWVWERFIQLLDRVGGVGGNGLWLVVLAVVVALVIFVMVRRTGRLQRRLAAPGDVFTDLTLSAADHRARAEKAAALSQWGEAVLEGFRALVRQLEERGAIDQRAGRTADEAARDAGVAFGELTDDLRAAALVFDEVAYGDRSGTVEAYAQIVDMDRAITRSTMVRS